MLPVIMFSYLTVFLWLILFTFGYSNGNHLEIICYLMSLDAYRVRFFVLALALDSDYFKIVL